MTKRNQDIENYYQGDALELDVTVTDQSGNPVDLTGAESTWVLSRRQGEPAKVERSTANGGIDYPNPEEGHLIVTVPSGETADLRGYHYHELEVVDSAGRETVVLTGSVVIQEDSTTS